VKRVAPAVDRNKTFIADVLARVLPARGLILEVASGSGQHAVFFARRFPEVTWQPTDRDDDALASIAAWSAQDGPSNLRPALRLDAASPATWPLAACEAVVCINMIHIAPWTACLGLLDGAARALSPAAPLVLYGPFHVDGRPTSASNAAFDADLRARDPSWGVRDLAEVAAAAAMRGLELAEVVDMPANNKTVVLRRAAAPAPYLAGL